jgi:hypothetical protein
MLKRPVRESSTTPGVNSALVNSIALPLFVL